MAEKFADVKARMGYEAKPIVDSCMGCKYFASDQVPCEGWDKKTSYAEKNIRCAYPGQKSFKVAKRGKCNLHERRSTDE